MNFFDVLLILIFISLVIALIYKSVIIENYENKENFSNKLTTNDSGNVQLNNNEISCCKMKEQENINYIENNIGKIKDMFNFFDEYQNDIKENINYINTNKNKINQSIQLTKEMEEQYNKEQENSN
jgi:hypothetical protein